MDGLFEFAAGVVRAQAEEVKAEKQCLTEAVRRKSERPDPDWERGPCPVCGEVCVSNAYYIGGRGYVLYIECWASLGEGPTCSYRRVI